MTKKRSGKKKIKEPIMTIDEECFMAHEGLIDWTRAVIRQARRLDALRDMQVTGDFNPENSSAFHVECHYFSIAANKVIEYLGWIRSLNIENQRILFKVVDFSEIDRFSKQDICDLRNMREHVVDYFRGEGRVKERWLYSKTPEYIADASSVINKLIGGRLDWGDFSSAAERLLPALLADPTPYPSPSIPEIMSEPTR
jgi:hypothetical protein